MEIICLDLNLELYGHWESLNCLCMYYSMFLWVRVVGFTGLIKERVKWLLSLPQLNPRLGAHVSRKQTHAIMAHHAFNICFDTPGSSRDVMELFSSPHTHGKVRLYVFIASNPLLKIKCIKLKGDLTSWLWHKLLKGGLLCHVLYVFRHTKKI